MNNESFLILFLVMIAIMGLGPFLLRRLHIPSVIALLIVGMLIGPNCGNLIGYLSKALKFLGNPPEQTASYFMTLVDSLGSLGLVFLMALAGMEADFKLIKSAKKPVIALSILTFLIPAVTGYFVYAHFKPDDLPGKLLYASLFASHSVGIVFPVIRELGISKTKFGASVLISTVVTDISSIILLAVSVQMRKQSLLASPSAGGVKTLSLFDYIDPSIFGAWFTPVFLLIVIAYLLLSVWIVSKAGVWCLRHFQPGEDVLITILLFVIMATVLAGEFLGVNLVVGAFIAGLALSRLAKSRLPAGGELMNRFESIGYGLLIPFLFVSIGMQTDFRAFGSLGHLSIVLCTVLGLVLSKIFSGFLALRISGFSSMHGLCAGLMTVPQLSATLAAAAVGKQLGMLSDEFFNAIIILSIVTTLPIPTIVRLIITKTKMQFHDIGDIEYKVPKAVSQDDLL